jgi:hypothetical protein
MATGIPLPTIPPVAYGGGALPNDPGMFVTDASGNPAGIFTYYAGTPAAVNWAPFPAWWDIDFVRLPQGVVAAVAPMAANGNYGQLQVWHYDDAEIPNATDSVTLETEGVYNLALLLLPDGTLDVLYQLAAHVEQLQHRRSRDGGETWSAATTYTFGSIPASAAAQQLMTNHALIVASTPPLAGASSSLGAVYVPALARAVVTLWASGLHPWILTGERTDTGWNWKPEQPATGGSAIGAPLSALPDGSVLAADGGQFYAPDNSGRFLQRSILSLTPPAAFDARRSLWLDLQMDFIVGYGFADALRDLPYPKPYAYGGSAVAAVNGDWHASASYVSSYLRNSPGAGSGPLSAPRLTGFTWTAWPAAWFSWWLSHPGPVPYQSYFQFHPGCLRMRKDGVFEFLRPTFDGTLKFARCRQVNNAGFCQWDGDL